MLTTFVFSIDDLIELAQGGEVILRKDALNPDPNKIYNFYIEPQPSNDKIVFKHLIGAYQNMCKLLCVYARFFATDFSQTLY